MTTPLTEFKVGNRVIVTDTAGVYGKYHGMVGTITTDPRPYDSGVVGVEVFLDVQRRDYLFFTHEIVLYTITEQQILEDYSID